MSNIEGPIVAKFGGSSMAGADSIRRVADIVRSNPVRRFIVVSAPGTNSRYSRKITALLKIASIFEGHVDYDEGKSKTALEEFSERFSHIGRDLGCSLADAWIKEAREGIFPGNGDWSMSRGEWLMARIFSSHLGATFIDATEIIRLQSGRHVNPISYDLIRERLSLESGLCVIPGFYGLNGIGEVETFPPGGSDLTGAVVARGLNARVYENWTDVDGVLAANPKVVDRPSTIDCLTYEEMRELGIRGANVLQRDTILSLFEVGTPINVRNTFNPQHSGTMVVPERSHTDEEHVRGITGEGGFVSFNIQKFGMNDEVGIGRRILEPFSTLGVSYEHSPSGRDYVSVIVNQDQLDGSESFIVNWLDDKIQPDRIWVQRNLGLLSLVGQGIRDHAARVSRLLFSALDDASIAVRAFSFGASGISMVIAVDQERIADAQRVVYEKFIFPT